MERRRLYKLAVSSHAILHSPRDEVMYALSYQMSDAPSATLINFCPRPILRSVIYLSDYSSNVSRMVSMSDACLMRIPQCPDCISSAILRLVRFAHKLHYRVFLSIQRRDLLAYLLYRINEIFHPGVVRDTVYIVSGSRAWM